MPTLLSTGRLRVPMEYAGRANTVPYLNSRPTTPARRGRTAPDTNPRQVPSFITKLLGRVENLFCSPRPQAVPGHELGRGSPGGSGGPVPARPRATRAPLRSNKNAPHLPRFGLRRSLSVGGAPSRRLAPAVSVASSPSPPSRRRHPRHLLTHFQDLSYS